MVIRLTRNVRASNETGFRGDAVYTMDIRKYRKRDNATVRISPSYAVLSHPKGRVVHKRAVPID
jgi:hypothetical protein